MEAQKQTTTILQSKPKNKFLNRVFPLSLAIFLQIGTYYLVVGKGSPLIFITEKVGSPLLALIIICSTVFIGVTLVTIGLLLEAWNPSLDFTLNKKRKWLFASIILFSVFIFLNIWWWIAHGLPNWVPNFGWQAAIIEWFFGVFTTDTSIFSLFFGILFLTKSIPQKSSNYKFMLRGAVIHNLVLFPVYILSALGLTMPDPRMVNFWGYTIFQPWFQCDFISEIVVFIGAICLLRRSMNVKKLILIVIVLFIVLFLLLGSVFRP